MTEELQELEPLEELPGQDAQEDNMPPPGMPPGPGGMPAMMAAAPPTFGLPAPAYNPNIDKEYPRFLWAGVIILIGAIMPWGPGPDLAAGYYTLGGFFTLLVGLGIVRSWWGAISVGRFKGTNLGWVALSTLPLIFQVLAMISAFETPEMISWVESQRAHWNTLQVEGPTDWGKFFGLLFDMAPASQSVAREFLWQYGIGRMIVLIGCLLAELFLLMGLFGGAKTAKAQKAELQAKSAAKNAGKGGGRRR